MAQGLALLLALALGLLQPGRGQPLSVEPPEPVVAVALGGSQELTCRMACAHGAAVVQWRGLDTSMGAVQSDAGSSVLSVRGASLSTAGTRVCVGTCGGRTFQQKVQLLVYAFPDQLTVSPAALVPGRDREVACTAHNVTPAEPDALSFSLFLGHQELEGVHALGREEEEEPQEAEDPLFRVTGRWLLPPLGTPTPHSLRCQATMRLPGLELSHHRDLPVLHSQTSPEPPDPTTPESPDATSRLATPQQGSTRSPEILSSTGTCHPEILQTSEAGRESGWELLCQASCGPGMAVRWTLAPGGLEAYDRKETGTQAWLRVPLARPSPEGWFQCRMDPGGQVASLYVPDQKLIPKTSPSPEVIPAPTALWASSLVLGLLLLAIPAYRLWKRCQQVPEDPTSFSVAPAIEGQRETGGPA